MPTHENVKPPALPRRRFFALLDPCFDAPSRPMSDEGFVSMGDTLLVRIEEDLVFIRNQRIMTLTDFNTIVEVYSQVRNRHGSFFVMYDSSRAQGVERAARKAMTSTPAGGPTALATAIFGAPFAIRTLGNMLERALVGLKRPSPGMRFFQTEADARDYLQQERLRLKATL